MLDPLKRYRVRIQDAPATSQFVPVLVEHGLVLLDGLNDSTDLLRLTRSMGTAVPHRNFDSIGVTALADGGTTMVRSGYAGFSTQALDPHTDRSGVTSPPALLIMGCGQPAASGGECIVVDGQAIYGDLAESEPDALRAFCTPRSALFGGAAGYLGSIFARVEDGRVSIRLRLDDLARFSPEVTRWLPVLRQAFDRHAITFSLSAGHGYVLNNHRWLHGRRAFQGHRVLYRINGNPMPHLGIPSGFRVSRRLVSSTVA